MRMPRIDRFIRRSCGPIPISLLFILIGFAASPPAALPADVTLAWDPSTGPGLAGYKIYYGTASGRYTNSVDVGNVTTYVVTGLSPGTWYFAATAYDSTRKETVSSNEVSVLVAAADTQAPVISGVAASGITTSAAAIGWTTNEPSSSQVEYGPTTAYGTVASPGGAMATSHAVLLGALLPSTTYHYRVLSADAAGNLSVSSDATFTTLAPADITPPVISGVSSSSVSGTAATITWTTNEAADSQVEYGLSTSYGLSTTLDTAKLTSHTQVLTGLAENTIYHYRVKSKDAANNGAVSTDYGFTTLDSTAPVISGVSSSSVTATSATITWTTNEAADGRVEYGLSTAYGSSTTLDPARSASHAQSLTGLTEKTIYHYRVRSKDAAGNEAFSADYTFTTIDATPPVISGVSSSSVTGTSATITWTTNEAADSQVEYGLSTAYGSSTTLDPAKSTLHAQALTGLAEKTTYYYRVKSKDNAGNLAISSSATFTTVTAADTTAPVINAVSSSSVTGTSATITWITNEAADSQVEYGVSTAYGSSSTLNAARATSHAQALTGLTEKTIYHYRVKSKDAEGNGAVSADYTFTTLDATPPVISGVSSSSVTGTSATITWTTNEAADGRVEYGLSTAYGSSVFNAAQSTAHSQVLSGLTEGKTYHYRVTSKDAAGNAAVSADYAFATTPINDVTAGLVAAYGFDEGAGSVTSDYSSNLNTAVLKNVSWSPTAKFGRALSFNGKNSYVSAGVAGLPDIGTPKTIACWVYMNSKPASIQSTVTLANPVQKASVKQGTRTSQAGALRYGDTWLVASALPSVKKWHHFAYVFDGLMNRFYVDGVLASTSTVPSNMAPVTSLDIGRSNPASEYYKGIIDEVRIYNRALSQAEVKSIMTAPIANLKGTTGAAAPSQMAMTETAQTDASGEDLAIADDAADATVPYAEGSLPVVEVGLTQRYYGVGEVVTAGSYRVSNPSDHGREIELKTWVEGPGLAPVPVWGFGADEAFKLPPGYDEDYGPLGLFDVSGDLPAGSYQFKARVVDPVTGDIFSEDGKSFAIGSEGHKRSVERRDEPVLLADMQQWGELGVTNAGGGAAVIEVKIWLEAPGRSPVAVLSVGADGSLVLAPGAAMTLDPLSSFDPPPGSWTVKFRILDPVTARIVLER